MSIYSYRLQSPRRHLKSPIWILMMGSLLFSVSSNAATLIVNDPSPDAIANGFCSLIEAIDNANADAQLHFDCGAGSGADTIQLEPLAVYTLTAADNSDQAPTGLPTITSTMTIEGGGATVQRSALAGTPEFRLLSVGDTGNLTINSLILRNGRTGHPPEFPSAGQAAIIGSGVLNMGVLTLNDSEVRDNWGETFHGGGIGSVGTLIINNSIIADNSAGDDGGGIAGRGSMLVNFSTISNNTAGDELAGGILWEVDEAIIRGTIISGNEAGIGGGIANTGTLSLLDSTVYANTAGDFGPGQGGGIYNRGILRLFNTTVSRNLALNGGTGGGLLNRQSATPSGMVLVNSTVAENSAAVGGNVANENNSQLDLQNTIIANSGDGGDCDNAGTIGTNVASLAGDGSCNADFSGDPQLGALADNGGPTLTHALMPTSPAIDNGNNGICSALPIGSLDQRGEPRPIDGNGDGFAQCDIGAYEVQETTPTCNGLIATIYVDQQGIIHGGPTDGLPYFGILIGTSGDDVMVGTVDSDKLFGGKGSDSLCGGAGGNDLLAGGHGADVLIAGAGNDLLLGAQGNDLLTGGAGADFFIGGGGNDTASDFTLLQGDIAVSVEAL